MFMLKAHSFSTKPAEWHLHMTCHLAMRLSGREFESHQLLALLGKLFTPTGLAGRSGLVLAYLAAV